MTLLSAYAYVWHDSCISVTWLMHKCDMTHANMGHDSYIRVTRLMHTCDTTHAYVWHGSFMCVTWFVLCALGHVIAIRCVTHQRLIHTCDTTHSHVWRIHICDITRLYDLEAKLESHDRDEKILKWLSCDSIFVSSRYIGSRLLHPIRKRRGAHSSHYTQRGSLSK